jgi:hypothetical protein
VVHLLPFHFRMRLPFESTPAAMQETVPVQLTANSWSPERLPLFGFGELTRLQRARFHFSATVWKFVLKRVKHAYRRAPSASARSASHVRIDRRGTSGDIWQTSDH